MQKSAIAAAPNDGLIALEHAAGFLRHELGQRVRIKYLPELRFVHDGSAAYASHIQEALNEIEPEEGWNEQEL